MEKSQANLMQIGAFLRTTQLSRKALRLYDQLDILTPTHIDPDTGYRYYTATQIPTARFIRLMREAEMPLETIRKVLTAESPTAAEALIISHRREFDEKAKRVQQASRRIMAYLRHEEDQMSFDIEVKKVPQQKIISITKAVKIGKLDTFIQEGIGSLLQVIEEQGLKITGEATGYYHGPINENDSGPIEVAFSIMGDAKPVGGIVVKELPSFTAAAVTGGSEYYKFPAVLQLWDAVVDWVRQNDYDPHECPVASHEVWHKERIEVVWPFK